MNKRIFIYIKDKEQLPLVYPMVNENPEYEYGIIIENTTLDDFLRTPTGKLSNIQFVETKKWKIASLSTYGVFISTDTSMGNSGSETLMILLNVFSALNVPIFDLQEKLFAIQHNAFSLATHHLNWYDNKQHNSTVIGYPISANKQNTSNGEYILVITDLYRECYTGQDINNFFSAIYEYARTHTGAAIIWKMSDKEIANANISRVQNNYNAFYEEELRKISLCNEHTLLGKLSTSELIAKAKLVITTPTMPRLLDCELFGKPVAIYISNTNTINERIDIRNTTIFHNAEELEQVIFDKPCKYLHTGLLNFYDNDAFISAINNFYKICDINPKKYIESLLLSSILLGRKVSTTQTCKNGIPNVQTPTLEIEKLKFKNRKHLKVIRKMAIGLGFESIIIAALLVFILLM